MKFRMLMQSADDVTQVGGTGEPVIPAGETTPAPEQTTEVTPKVEDPAGEEDLGLFEEDPQDFSAGIDIETPEYELELSEESNIPEEAFDALVEEARSQGLTKEEALSRMASLEKAYASAEDEFIKKRTNQMKEELYKHEYFDTPEKRKIAQEDIARALKEYKSPELAKLVKEDKFFKHNPTLMKLLVDMGKSLRTDTVPLGNPEGAKSQGGNSQEQYFKEYYPTMFPS